MKKLIQLFYWASLITSFLPRDAMHKRVLCRHAVCILLSVTFVCCVKTSEHSNTSLNFFHHSSFFLTLYKYYVYDYDCKNSSMLYRFWVIWRWKISWSWTLGQRSLKFIQTGTIRKPECSFLFTFHCNNGYILHYFRDKAIYWSKIVIVFHTPWFDAPVRRVAVGLLLYRLVRKTRMVGLPEAVKILRICITV